MTETIINRLFLHVSGYDDAPEFSISDEGIVRVDDEVVGDPLVIVKALADNARAWGKCVAAVEPPPPPVTGALAKDIKMVVQQITAVEIRGPWPSPEGDDQNDLSDERITEIEAGDDLSDERIDEIEAGDDVVG